MVEEDEVVLKEDDLAEEGLHIVEEIEEDVPEIDPVGETDDLLIEKKKIIEDAEEEEDPELSDKEEVEEYMFDALYGDR